MAPDASALPPLRSMHTSNFPQLLHELGVSLLVSTYQAGKLVLLRADGERVNTHFRNFNKPMGIALDGDRLAIGTTLEIWEYHNAPAVAQRLEPAGRCDACFLPRTGHVTGDIQIHEMAWSTRVEGGGWRVEGDIHSPRELHPPLSTLHPPPELWFVNTRFSCLCTRDSHHSFVPRWRPAFITALAPEDRCHLNGLCVVDGRPAFVTALGVTDTPAGWRANKRDGGILIEVETGDILLQGLAMPHSPRWHDGKLWLLESGRGGIGWVDPWARQYERIAELPGFTRGVDFIGRLAFIGLSQVRESAVFSDIPIAERSLAERCCGVWVVDTHTGQTVAFLKFEDAVQEIFAVQVMPGVRCPDVINDDSNLLANSFVVPDEALSAVPAPLCCPVAKAGRSCAHSPERTAGVSRLVSEANGTEEQR